MKILSLIIVSFILIGCTALDPRSREDIVAGWDDWELCHRLAKMTFKGNSKWLWHVTSEINRRNLNANQKCKTIYDARFAAYVRKSRSSSIQITFGQALAGSSPSFENVTK